MKALLFLTLFSMQCTHAQEADVQKAVTDFFVAFHAKDTTSMRAAFHKDVLLHSISEKPSGAGVEVETAKEMLESIASIPAGVQFEERLLSWKIDIDGSMAHVWTPYEFYIDGKRSHGGVDSFTMIKDGGMWKILYLVDTRRK